MISILSFFWQQCNIFALKQQFYCVTVLEALLSTEGGTATRPPAHSNLYPGNEQRVEKNCKHMQFLKMPAHETDRFLGLVFCQLSEPRGQLNNSNMYSKNYTKKNVNKFIPSIIKLGLKTAKKAASIHLILPRQWNMAGKMKQNGIVLSFFFA